MAEQAFMSDPFAVYPVVRKGETIRISSGTTVKQAMPLKYVNYITEDSYTAEVIRQSNADEPAVYWSGLNPWTGEPDNYGELFAHKHDIEVRRNGIWLRLVPDLAGHRRCISLGQTVAQA